MDTGATRVEIELDANEPKRSRRRADAPPLAPPVPVAAPAEPAPQRHRVAITAIAVGLVALFLGWVLGRAGGDEGAPTTGSAPTTREAPPATTAAPGELLPAAELPSTTRPRPTTTTTQPPTWTLDSVDIDPRLADQADRLVLIRDDGALMELDLPSGFIRVLERDRPTAAAPLPPVAGDDWVVVAFDDGQSAQLYRDGELAGTPLPAAEPWSVLWEPARGVYWQRGTDESGRSLALHETDVDGKVTGRTIDTHGLWARESDPAGGVIVGDGNVGAYRAAPDGEERIADGFVMAAGVNHLLVYACAENFDSCGTTLVERATGTMRTVPLSDDIAIEVVSTVGWWPTAGTPRIDAGGTSALLSVSDDAGEPSWLILDLATGTTIVYERPEGGAFDVPLNAFAYPSWAWSTDGRFLYVVEGRTVLAYDQRTGAMFDVMPGDDAPPIGAVAIRPA